MTIYARAGRDVSEGSRVPQGSHPVVQRDCLRRHRPAAPAPAAVPADWAFRDRRYSWLLGVAVWGPLGSLAGLCVGVARRVGYLAASGEREQATGGKERSATAPDAT